MSRRALLSSFAFLSCVCMEVLNTALEAFVDLHVQASTRATPWSPKTRPPPQFWSWPICAVIVFADVLFHRWSLVTREPGESVRAYGPYSACLCSTMQAIVARPAPPRDRRAPRADDWAVLRVPDLVGRPSPKTRCFQPVRIPVRREPRPSPGCVNLQLLDLTGPGTARTGCSRGEALSAASDAILRAIDFGRSGGFRRLRHPLRRARRRGPTPRRHRPPAPTGCRRCGGKNSSSTRGCGP